MATMVPYLSNGPTPTLQTVMTSMAGKKKTYQVQVEMFSLAVVYFFLLELLEIVNLCR
jgi:hypothetical protein